MFAHITNAASILPVSRYRAQIRAFPVKIRFGEISMSAHRCPVAGRQQPPGVSEDFPKILRTSPGFLEGNAIS
jgi:hypothetical protein